MTHTIVVLGGGIIGCSVAHELALRGHSVRLWEAERCGAGASTKALGLLFAHVHASDFDPAVLAAERESLALFPEWVAQMRQSAGPAAIDPHFRTNGLIELAQSAEHRAELQTRQAAESAHGIDARWLEPAELRKALPTALESALGGLWYPGSMAVDVRALIALAEAAAKAEGVVVETGRTAVELAAGPSGEICGARTADGHAAHADWTVVATGAHASALLGPRAPQITPIRGQAVRLRLHRADEVPSTSVTDGKVTAVPYGDSVVVGGTVEDVGFAPYATPDGLRFVLDRASQLLEGLAGAEVVECWGGLRPKSTEAAPTVGVLSPGLAAAVGHYRSGVIFAPWTARRLADALS